jgi:hypothetical protein
MVVLLSINRIYPTHAPHNLFDLQQAFPLPLWVLAPLFPQSPVPPQYISRMTYTRSSVTPHTRLEADDQCTRHYVTKLNYAVQDKELAMQREQGVCKC